MPVWHASIAVLDPTKLGRPLPLHAWGGKRLEKARRRALDLLSGVGEGPDLWREGDGALHLRRRLSGAEISRIDPGWLALPAIDGE